MLSLLLFASVVALQPQASDDFDTLARWLPERVNAIGLVNVAALRTSPAGRVMLRDPALELANLPGTVDRLVTSGVFRPASGRGEWQHGVVQFSQAVDLEVLAKRYDAQPATLGGVPGVVTKQGLAFLKLNDQLVGIHAAKDPAVLERWVQAGRDSNTVALSPALRAFVKETSGAPVRFYVDTTGIFDAEGVRATLTRHPALAKDKVLLEKVAAQIEGLKGIAFYVRATDEFRGILRFDFATDPLKMDPMLFEIFREALVDQGAWIKDFDEWKGEIRGRSVYLEGRLSPDGLNRTLVALLALPRPSQTASRPATPEDLDAAATQRYVLGMEGVITDLRKQLKDLRTPREFAYWYNYTARKLDELAPAGVQADIVAANHTMADKLRLLAASVRGAEVDLKKLSSYKRSASLVTPAYAYESAWSPGWGLGGYSYYYTPGGAWFANNHANVNQLKSEVAAEREKERTMVWQSILQDLADARRLLAKDAKEPK